MQEQQAQQQQNRYAAMIRVIKLVSLKSRKHIDEFSFQIQYVHPSEGYNIPLSSRKTNAISKESPVWMQDIYFNNCEINNSFQFTLHCSEKVKFESRTIQGIKLFRNLRESSQMGRQSFNLKFHDEANSEAIVQIEISVFLNEDFLVGLQPPQISLAGLKQHSETTKYSAIDILKPPFFNCFSCMDQPLENFDRLECFPKKFKTKNRPKLGQ